MRRITEIIIHCADTPNGRKFHAADITRWHQERGWRTIGYHFVVCVDGSVENGRGLEEIGAHAVGHNAHSVGICLIGRDRFTQAQWVSLSSLVSGLVAQFSNAKVLGHYHVDQHGKTCPNFDVSAWFSAGAPDERNVLEVGA